MIIPRFPPPVKREIHFFSQFLRAFAWKRIRADTIRGNRRMEVQKADENDGGRRQFGSGTGGIRAQRNGSGLPDYAVYADGIEL